MIQETFLRCRWRLFIESRVDVLLSYINSSFTPLLLFVVAIMKLRWQHRKMVCTVTSQRHHGAYHFATSPNGMHRVVDVETTSMWHRSACPFMMLWWWCQCDVALTSPLGKGMHRDVAATSRCMPFRVVAKGYAPPCRSNFMVYTISRRIRDIAVHTISRRRHCNIQ